MNELKKVLQIANNEIGYLEKKTNSQLDDKTANAGSNNYTKYARDLDNISGFYNGKKNGYAWCDIFVDWCFVQAVGVERAKELLCQVNKLYGAGCGNSLNYYKEKEQFYTSPQIGDQIFFKKGNVITHTGLVVDVDSNKVYTIEGNTSSASGVISNGGAVEKKSYNLTSNYIAGYGRPLYKEETKMFKEGQEFEAIDYLVAQGRITNKELALKKLDTVKDENWIFIKWANDVKSLVD